jgi:hypothetical protein
MHSHVIITLQDCACRLHVGHVVKKLKHRIIGINARTTDNNGSLMHIINVVVWVLMFRVQYTERKKERKKKTFVRSQAKGSNYNIND